MALYITPQIQIDESEFELSYARSSGPGGQNVNKVNSKAVLRWNIYLSRSLRPEIRTYLLSRLGTQISLGGDIVIMSDRFRDQTRNREDCFEKFRVMLAQAAHKPKARKKTKPTRSSERKAREHKSRHSQKKKLRSSSRDYD